MKHKRGLGGDRPQNFLGQVDTELDITIQILKRFLKLNAFVTFLMGFILLKNSNPMLTNDFVFSNSFFL